MIFKNAGTALKNELDKIYLKYDHRKYVHPDPLEFLYDYKEAGDREVIGLIASSLAYGRVSQILKSVSKVLKVLGPSPRAFLMDPSFNKKTGIFSDFKHRFTTGPEVLGLLLKISEVLKKYGSMNSCFLEGYSKNDATVIPAMLNFIKKFDSVSPVYCGTLIPSYTGNSAFKRLNLYLRWMVRKDNVDPGGWKNIPTSKLIVPLDTHMHSISKLLGFTKRKQADMKAAIEITGSFSKIDDDDPVKYDFGLTRLGMNRSIQKWIKNNLIVLSI